MASLLVLLLVSFALLVGTIGFRAGLFDPLNLIGIGLGAAVGVGAVVYCVGAPWLVG